MGGGRGAAAQRLSVAGSATPGSQRAESGAGAGSHARAADRAQPSAPTSGTGCSTRATATRKSFVTGHPLAGGTGP